jgi:hypothetical protein
MHEKTIAMEFFKRMPLDIFVSTVDHISRMEPDHPAPSSMLKDQT